MQWTPDILTTMVRGPMAWYKRLGAISDFLTQPLKYEEFRNFFHCVTLILDVFLTLILAKSERSGRFCEMNSACR